MVTIESLIRKQMDFDSRHGGAHMWNQRIDNNNIEQLEHLMVCLMGEVGETANIVKKVYRGDFQLSDVKDQIEEEVIDILIYTLKLAYQLDINIEKVYENKMGKNEKRFSKYEKESDMK